MSGQLEDGQTFFLHYEKKGKMRIASSNSIEDIVSIMCEVKPNKSSVVFGIDFTSEIIKHYLRKHGDDKDALKIVSKLLSLEEKDTTQLDLFENTDEENVKESEKKKVLELATGE